MHHQENSRGTEGRQKKEAVVKVVGREHVKSAHVKVHISMCNRTLFQSCKYIYITIGL